MNTRIYREARVPTRNVILTDSQSELVDRLVASGRHQSASEALLAGLLLLEREENAWSEMRGRLMSSLAQARRGEYAEGSGEDAFRRAFSRARELS